MVKRNMHSPIEGHLKKIIYRGAAIISILSRKSRCYQRFQVASDGVVQWILLSDSFQFGSNSARNIRSHWSRRLPFCQRHHLQLPSSPQVGSFDPVHFRRVDDSRQAFLLRCCLAHPWLLCWTGRS